jgi:multimeric flavodoxin WrbA
VLKGAASQGADTSRLYLNDLNISPCQSCGQDPKPKHCIINDDMNQIYIALETCDAIVLGSPVYFDTVSAQAKLMIDRCNCLMPCVKKPDGTFGFDRRIRKRRKGVFIAVAGIEQEFNTIQTTVNGFFNWTNIHPFETILYTHEDDKLGGVKDDRERMDRAFEAGIRLVKMM